MKPKKILKNSRIPLQKFSALWDIKLWIENRDMPPLIQKTFSIPQIFRKTEGFLYKDCPFGPVGQKNLSRIVMPPLICMKTFDKRVSLKHQSVLQWNNLVQSDQKFSSVNCDNPYHEEFFDTPTFLKHWRDAHELFRDCETKKIRRKNVIPPFSTIKLFETKNFLKNSRIPLRNFSAPWDIKISIENRDMPPPTQNFFSIPEIFRKTEGFLYKDCRFGSVRQKNSAESWCPPSYAWEFSIKDFVWNSTVFPNEIIWFSQTKTFRRKNVITPIMNKIFRNPKISKTLKGYPQNFQHCETQIFRRKNVIPPNMHKIFPYPEFPETFKVCPRKLSALWDPNFSTENVIPPLFIHKTFQNQKLSQKQ